jgi:hypothetical protein
MRQPQAKALTKSDDLHNRGDTREKVISQSLSVVSSVCDQYVPRTMSAGSQASRAAMAASAIRSLRLNTRRPSTWMEDSFHHA